MRHRVALHCSATTAVDPPSLPCSTFQSGRGLRLDGDRSRAGVVLCSGRDAFCFGRFRSCPDIKL